MLLITCTKITVNYHLEISTETLALLNNKVLDCGIVTNPCVKFAGTVRINEEDIFSLVFSSISNWCFLIACLACLQCVNEIHKC